MKLEGKRVVFLVGQEFEDIELWYPFLRLSEEGVQVLISAGIVKGKSMTCYKAVKDDLINAGANYEDSPVVVDGNIITSRVPDDLPDFCLKIIEKLAK